jgi:hypothetical protein
MVIILKHIPVKIRKQDIKDFLAPEVKGSWLRKSGQIQSVYILTQKNIQTHITQNHVLVEIFPDLVAERVIKKLNRKTVAGKYVAVCEYKIRNWHNDPRIKNITRKVQNDRRVGDRRTRYEETIAELNLDSR